MQDLFISAVTDTGTKHSRDLMGTNWFSLSKQTLRTIREIKHTSGKDTIKVTGSADHGIATIWDQDILVFLISQLVHQRDAKTHDFRDRESRYIRFTLYDYLKWSGKTKQGSAGHQFELFTAALNRLQHTFVETTIHSNDKTSMFRFNWINEMGLVDYHGGDEVKNKRRAEFSCIISAWLFDAVVRKNLILTLNEDYFRLTSSLEKFLYLYARKSAGSQKSGWTERIELLHEKSASSNSLKRFRYDLKRIASKGRILDYSISIDESDRVHFQKVIESQTVGEKTNESID